jgi:hypothetical protein
MTEEKWRRPRRTTRGTIAPDPEPVTVTENAGEHLREFLSQRDPDRIRKNLKRWLDELGEAVRVQIPKIEAAAKGKPPASAEVRMLEAALRIDEYVAWTQISVANLRLNQQDPVKQTAFRWFEFGYYVALLEALLHEDDAARGVRTRQATMDAANQKHGSEIERRRRKRRVLEIFDRIDGERNDLKMLAKYDDAAAEFSQEEKANGRVGISGATVRRYVAERRERSEPDY